MAHKIEIICDSDADDQFTARCYEIRTSSSNGWSGQFAVVGNDDREDSWTDELEVRDGQIVIPDRSDFDGDDDYHVTKIVNAKLTYAEVAEIVEQMFE